MNDNMNMRAAFLEVCNDALGSVAVIISSIVLMCTGWSGFDAIAGALIALLMIPRAYGLLHHAMRVLLEETPGMVSISTRCASTCWACRTFWPCMICMRASSPPGMPFSPRTSLLSRSDRGPGRRGAQTAAGLHATAFPGVDRAYHIPAGAGGVFERRRGADP